MAKTATVLQENCRIWLTVRMLFKVPALMGVFLVLALEFYRVWSKKTGLINAIWMKTECDQCYLDENRV